MLQINKEFRVINSRRLLHVSAIQRSHQVFRKKGDKEKREEKALNIGEAVAPKETENEKGGEVKKDIRETTVEAHNGVVAKNTQWPEIKNL